MKAVWYERTGPAREVLVFGEMPTPSPGPGEVLVRLAASGVNPSDWKSRAGSRPMPAPRVIPHSDGAGVIEAVGAGVAPTRIGERVWIWNGQWKRAFGTAAQYVALPAAQAVPLPAGVSFEAGACLGIPALTALHAALTDGGVAGQSVLVAGGAGAVGHYAIQFARLCGARQVIATVSSPQKAQHAMAAGADACVDYRREDAGERVRELTDGRGVDRVIEVDVAANGKQVAGLLRQEGLCVVYGSGAAEFTLPFFPLILRGAAFRFFIVYELSEAARTEAVARLTGWLEQGRVIHALAGALPLAECAAAHELVQSGDAMGNIVLSIA
jgi:NADPH2:quinone reductase